MNLENKSPKSPPKYPGERVTTTGNQLVAAFTESLICDAGVFYPITPSTEQGEYYQLQYAKGQLNAFGESFIAIETEGEHAAQGGAIAVSVTGKRVVNFTSGQGIAYGIEQYYHAPGKLSTMVLEVGARALTRHALNVHCGHDDVYSALDTGWIISFARDAQQCADQALILRKVTEWSLNPGMNCQDGMLTTHLERTFLRPEPALIREYLGRPDDLIDSPTEAQHELFGPQRRRVPAMLDLTRPLLLGPVQNQEHYMNGVAARRNHFSESILGFFEKAYAEFGVLTGREYGLISTYKCEEAETVFICIGSAAENIEAAIDYLEEKHGRKVGVIHVNVLRPFPEAAIIKALRGKKGVIVLERADEPLAGDNPLTRDVRVALGKAVENHFTQAHAHLASLDPASEMPEIFSGVYGLGSRDFRPESILGAYEYATGRTARQDGKTREHGERFFFLGIDHPYAVESQDKPSLLPHPAIAVRFHSIGGWGMITTGKNLGSILGAFSSYYAERENLRDAFGRYEDYIHVSANPKYGSEKKGAPTNYFLVAAAERIRVNCDLKHVDVVLCCDPKIFLHSNPFEGLHEGGAFVWESHCTSAREAWTYIPIRFRREIIQKKFKIYILNGFDIARAATKREDLQTRMQGNCFLGAFFKVSPLLKKFRIPDEVLHKTIRNQYETKFGKFGDDVVESNMKVMLQGYETVREVPHGSIDDLDCSTFCGSMLLPLAEDKEVPATQAPPLFRQDRLDAEYRTGYSYHQPASVLSSVGCMAAGTGGKANKYVARRQTPLFIPERCTQCMDCISVCPDTALPNTTQKITTILQAAIRNYVTEPAAVTALLAAVPEIESEARKQMHHFLGDKADHGHFREIVRDLFRNRVSPGGAVTQKSVEQVTAIIDILPLAYKNTPIIFKSMEKKSPGRGGLFSIFVSNLCKGCAACVEACGEKEALKMVPEDQDLHARHLSASHFLDLLPNTPDQYLGLFNAMSPRDSKAAALRFHLMVQTNYNALVSGDGACAGCGEKSVLRAIATLTETLMRPIFNNKANRLSEKAKRVKDLGPATLERLKNKHPTSYRALRRSLLHIIMDLGAECLESTDARILAEFKGSDSDLAVALSMVLLQDAANHRAPQTRQGTIENGMSVMAMTAHTGCNTVFGSTPPNNPHPYPWMNSLFQDGATIGWLVSESFIQNQVRRSVVPERLAAFLTGDSEKLFGEDDYFLFTHFSDTFMTDDEIMELPKVWVVGGDGGMGDIGFQNVSKVILQNRPNVNMLMLDTQVYSNTGGQNSDSSPLTGGFDMNSYGAASEGKLTEMKAVAECFLGGHGSPYVAQVSMANAANLFKAILDGLCYRGSSFFQAFTPCQPEHGIPDYASEEQALKARDSRGLPEFVFNPELGETFTETLNIKANPNHKGDWYRKPVCKGSRERYSYTVAHWAVTEGRFRNHFKKIKPEAAENMVHLEDILQVITMGDVVNRRHLLCDHRAFIPKEGIYMLAYNKPGKPVYYRITRQMVIFCVERRKAWRLLQSRAGIENPDYQAQKALISSLNQEELTRDTHLALARSTRQGSPN